MPKSCNSITGCKNNVYSHGFCQYHQGERRDTKWLKALEANRNGKAVKAYSSGIKRPSKPIAKNSKKRKKINASQYEPEARKFREEKKVCEVCPVLVANGIEVQCSGEAEAVHHVKGKATIELLLNKEFWMASCFWANSIWIEENSEKAEALKLKIPDYSSKLSKFKK